MRAKEYLYFPPRGSSMVMSYFLVAQDLQSISKRAPPQKPKRTNKAPGDRGPNARKKNKKEEVGKSAEALIKQLKQVNG